MTKKVDIDQSKASKDILRRAVENDRAGAFTREHKASIDAYNAFAKKHGTLAEAFEHEFGE
jgi:post-segregation antitoxin (ccd killing protein)